MSKELEPFSRTVWPGERVAIIATDGKIAYYFTNSTQQQIALRVRFDADRNVEVVPVDPGDA